MLGMNNTHCIFHNPPSTHTHTHKCTCTHTFSLPCFLKRSEWGFPRDADNLYASHFAAMASYPASLCLVSPRKCITDSSLMNRLPPMSSWNQSNRKNKDHLEYKESSIFLLIHFPWDVLSTAYEGQIPDLKSQKGMQSKLLLTIIFWVDRGTSEPCPAHRRSLEEEHKRSERGQNTSWYYRADPDWVRPKKEPSCI